MFLFFILLFSSYFCHAKIFNIHELKLNPPILDNRTMSEQEMIIRHLKINMKKNREEKLWIVKKNNNDHHHIFPVIEHYYTNKIFLTYGVQPILHFHHEYLNEFKHVNIFTHNNETLRVKFRKNFKPGLDLIYNYQLFNCKQNICLFKYKEKHLLLSLLNNVNVISINPIHKLKKNRILSTVSTSYMDHENLVNTYNLSGLGINILVTDTGLDPNHEMFYDPLHSVFYALLNTYPVNNTGHKKIQAYFRDDYGDFTDVEDSHGTMTSGQCAGFQALNQIGLAFNSKIVFLDCSTNGMTLQIPINLIETYTYLKAETNIVISTNSYGGCNNQIYSLDDYQFDSITENDPYLLIFFAAGNNDVNCPYSTVSTPALGKNVEVIGASFAQPSNYDGVITNPSFQQLLDYTSVNSFSNYGPLLDGRMAPRLFASGFNEPVAAGFLPNEIPGQDTFTYASGTSMSTPQIAGLAALFKEWYLNFTLKNATRNLVLAYLKFTSLSRQPIRTVDAFSETITSTQKPMGIGTPFLNFTQNLTYLNKETLQDQQRIAYMITQMTNFTLQWSDRPASENTVGALIDHLYLFVYDTTQQSGGLLNTIDKTNPFQIVQNLQPTHTYYLVVIAHVVDVRSFAFVTDGLILSSNNNNPCLPGEYIKCNNNTGLQFCNNSGNFGICYLNGNCPAPQILNNNNNCVCPPNYNGLVDENGNSISCVIYTNAQIAVSKAINFLHSSCHRPKVLLIPTWVKSQNLFFGLCQLLWLWVLLSM